MPRDGLDGDVPAIAGDAFRAVLEARSAGAPRRGRWRGETDGRDRRSVDQHPHGHDRVLVDRRVAVVEAAPHPRRTAPGRRTVGSSTMIAAARARSPSRARCCRRAVDSAASWRGWRRRRAAASASEGREQVTHAAKMPPVSLRARAARPRLRRVRGAGAIALRELSGRVAPAAGARCGRTWPRCTRLRAWPTTSPTKGTRSAGDPAGTARALAGAAARGRSALGPADPVEASADSRDALIFVALGHIDPIAQSADVALRRSAQRVRSGYHDDSIRLVARRCSTTAVARRIRSAVSCCASPGATIRRSIDRRTRSARRCS